jgi:Tfp pilus assembly protein PilF
MPHHRNILPLLLLASTLYAQSRPDATNWTGNVEVRVSLDGTGRCSMSHVEIVNTGGMPVAEGYTGDNCIVRFSNLPAGNYHALVSGPGIESSDTGQFEINTLHNTSVDATVRHAADTNQPSYVEQNKLLVSANKLKVPGRAQHELEEAKQQIQKQDWTKAAEKLNRAVNIYPEYAEAYNDLAFVYERLGDDNKKRESLQKAVSVDDHYAPALTNLARVAIADRNLPRAEALLKRAIATDPNNSAGLILLANIEILDGNYGDALSNCHKAHAGQGAHALAHYLAGRILEDQNRIADALAEFKMFLTEEPTGDRAEAVKTKIAALQSLTC